MNLKDKLVSKLLEIGKKHRILVYPMLALVAVVTAISHAICWGRGNGKKMVASIMVVALLITQSLFLTSSAVNNGDDANAANVSTATDAVNDTTDTELNMLSTYVADGQPVEDSAMPLEDSEAAAGKQIQVTYHVVSVGDGAAVPNVMGTYSYTDGEKVQLPDANGVLSLFKLSSEYFKAGSLYLEQECTNPITEIMPENDQTNYDVYVKITRTAYKVFFTDTGDDDQATQSWIVSVTDPTEGELCPHISWKVPTAAEGKYYKWGYTYQGINGHSAGDTYPIWIGTYESAELSVPVQWEPMQNLKITYKYFDDDSTLVAKLNPVSPDKVVETVTAAYNSELTLPSLSSDLIKNTGYYFAGWKIENAGDTIYAAETELPVTLGSEGTPALVKQLADISTTPNVEGITLVGQWVYKNVDIYVNDEKASDESNTVTIEGTYGMPFDKRITAKYSYDEIESPEIVLSDMNDMGTKLGQYSLGILSKTDSFQISGIPNSVVDETYQFTIEDKNNPDATNLTYTLHIKINPLPVTIGTVYDYAGHELTKEYDASDTIPVQQTADVQAVDVDSQPSCIGTDGVKVTFDSTAKILPTNGIAGKNVGKGKTIELSNLVIKTSTGKEKCYKLQEISDAGTLQVSDAAEITQRTLYVDVTYKDAVTSVKFGQDDPECVLTVTNPEKIADADYKDNPDALFNVYLNDKSAYTSNRKLYSSAGSGYSITPTFRTDGNYRIVVNTPVPTFAVTRDAAKDNYRILEQPSGDWYSKYTIVADNEYDSVRILTGAQGDITDTMSRAEVEKLFKKGSDALTADGTYTNIRFQLYSTKTKAVTDIYTIPGPIKIDTKIPVYKSHTVAPAGLVNQFGFGSYYHSQNGQSAMILTITYHSDYSKCETLHYYFAPEGTSASAKPDKTTDVRMTDLGGGDYAATITIGNTDRGQLVVWVTDEKKSESAYTKLVCYKKDNNTGTNVDDAYYEWMVEDALPTAVMTLQGNGSDILPDTWYNTITATIQAEDSDSGINYADWTINTASAKKHVTEEALGASATKDAKLKEYTFKQNIRAGESADYTPGEYKFSAVVYDNAGNQVAVAQQGPFLFDGNAPTLKLSDDGKSQKKYQSNVTLVMDASEKENESGIASIKLYKGSTDTDPINEWTADGTFTMSQSQKIEESGTYYVVVTDRAGNQTTDSVTYSYISSEKPDAPKVSIAEGTDGARGNDGWLIKAVPTVTIQSSTQTEGGVPVTTYYKIIYTSAGATREKSGVFSEAETTFDLQSDMQGDVEVQAWAESESNVQSETVTTTAKVDIDGPDVTITDSIVDAEGNVNISFQAVDTISGVDVENVRVNGKLIAVTETDGVVKGTFKADGSASYEIIACDIAGNASKPVSFIPLELQATPITKITSTAAHIDVTVKPGTNPVSKTNCTIEYKKATDTAFDSVLVNRDDANGVITMNYDFTKLTPNTVYEYRVRAVTEKSSEERVITGRFQTLTGASTTTIFGNAVYADSMPESETEKPIYVNLYYGTTNIGGDVVAADSEDGRYMFTGISDGTYRIVATNGTFSKEAFVTVEGGLITYPENYGASGGNGGVNFELDGYSTRVLIDDGDVEVAVDGLEKIYDTEKYSGNITPEDQAIVAAGGRIDIVLHASYIKVSDVTSAEQGIFADKLGKRAEIVRYINLYIEKNVYDKDGNYVEKNSTRLARLADPVTISFPLEDLAGQNIKVASLHAEGTDYTFKTWTDASEATLTHDYVIINTDRFSTYALYRVTQPKTYTVVWKDGDGKVLKTETVEEGASATPPEGTPTKTPTKDYTYTFEGWDQDYSNVSKDMVILAWFYSTKKGDTTENPGTTEQPGNNNGSTDVNGNDKTQNTTVTPGNNSNNGNNGGQNTSKNPVKYTYIGASGSPKTGDATPIVLLVCAFAFAGAGIVLIMKKKKEQ